MKNATTSLPSVRPGTQQALGQFVQVVVLVLVWLGAAGLVRLTGLSISVGVLGLFAVLALLQVGVLDVARIKSGSSWLLNELILFFIPGVVAVVQYQELLRREGVQLLFAIASGTLLVMACTALAVHAACRLERRLLRRTVSSGATGGTVDTASAAANMPAREERS